MGLLFSSEEIQGPVNPSSSQSSFEDAKKDTDYIKALGLKDRAKAAIIGAFVADSLSVLFPVFLNPIPVQKKFP